MKIIKITTQAEFDKLPPKFEEFTDIQIYGDVEVSTAWENSNVTARENSNVTAWENSNVTVWENSNVTARGNSSVHTYSVNPILLFGLSIAFLLTKTAKAIKKSKKTTIIQGIVKDGKTKNWLDLEGVEIKNNTVILFKRVSKDFKTQENTENETIWNIGDILIHKSWEPKIQECGKNKFHACSHSYFCDDFRDNKDDKYIAIEIKVKDLYSWPNPQYPHKIAFRAGKVLYQCDKNGKKL